MRVGSEGPEAYRSEGAANAYRSDDAANAWQQMVAFLATQLDR